MLLPVDVGAEAVAVAVAVADSNDAADVTDIFDDRL